MARIFCKAIITVNTGNCLAFLVGHSMRTAGVVHSLAKASHDAYTHARQDGLVFHDGYSRTHQ